MPARQRACTAPEELPETRFRVNRQTHFGGSFFLLNGEPIEPWTWAFPDVSLSYVTLPPPPEPDRVACYAASLAADDLLEDVRASLRDGDDLSARMALHALAASSRWLLASLAAHLRNTCAILEQGIDRRSSQRGPDARRRGRWRSSLLSWARTQPEGPKYVSAAIC
jgi:hypothetical protein